MIISSLNGAVFVDPYAKEIPVIIFLITKKILRKAALFLSFLPFKI
jgi:hypothetical protein